MILPMIFFFSLPLWASVHFVLEEHPSSSDGYMNLCTRLTMHVPFFLFNVSGCWLGEHGLHLPQSLPGSV